MAYQAPAFYFYHAARVVQEATSLPAPTGTPEFRLYDDRLGEVFQFEAATTGSCFVYTDRELTAAADAVDTIIITGHNFQSNGLDIKADAVDSSDTGNTTPMLPLTTVTAADRVPIIETLTPRSTSPHDRVQLQIEGVTTPFPELTEIYWTTKREMVRGPEPGWEHPWVRTQRRFLSDGGVSTTWMTGPARKRFQLTWRYLEGDDRQIFLDMREQTDDWSRPFWFRPPDTTYPTLLVELDRDDVDGVLRGAVYRGG